MQSSSPTYHPKNFFPLRDYSDFYSPKREIAGEEVMIDKVQEYVKRYYFLAGDFEFFHEESKLEKGKALDLQMSAAVLRFLACNNTKTKVKALNFKGIETAQDLAKLVQKAFDYVKYGLKKTGGEVVLSLKTLLAKAKAFLKSAFSLSFLVHKSEGNKNAAKAYKKDATDILLAMYANPATDVKHLESEIFDRYNEVARGERRLVNPLTGEVFTKDTKELPLIRSKSTIWNFFSNEWVKRITAKLRHGNKYYNDHYKGYVKGQKPKFALSFVSSDGQTVPFRLRINGNDTYKRATCYFVFDVATGAIVGYSINLSETKALMAEAFGDMLRNTKGVCPHEVQLDNFGKSYLKDLEQIFPQVSFCKPFSPQSKYAERFIGHFEQKYCRKVEGWTGANITGKNKHNAHRRNPDYKQVTYSLEEIRLMYAQMVKKYNSEVVRRKGKTRKELLETTVNPGCERIKETTLASLFGKVTMASVSNGYTRIEVDAKKYYFRVPDHAKVAAQFKNGKRVRVRYLPYLLDSKIWIYNFDKLDIPNLDNDIFLSEAVAIKGAQRAKAEQELKDVKEIGKMYRWVADSEQVDDEAAAQIQPLVDENDVEAVLSSGNLDKYLVQGTEEMQAKNVDEQHHKEAKSATTKKHKKKSKKKNKSGGLLGLRF